MKTWFFQKSNMTDKFLVKLIKSKRRYKWTKIELSDTVIFAKNFLMMS